MGRLAGRARGAPRRRGILPRSGPLLDRARDERAVRCGRRACGGRREDAGAAAKAPIAAGRQNIGLSASFRVRVCS